MQDLCGYPKSGSLHAYRRRTSYTRYVVSRRADESYRERVRSVGNSKVWHWEETTNQLFSPYVNMFLKIKQEASGYPKHCVTDEHKQQYIDEYYEHEGIRLDPEKIEYNSGLRWLAKLMLNSLWGM